MTESGEPTRQTKENEKDITQPIKYDQIEVQMTKKGSQTNPHNYSYGFLKKWRLHHDKNKDRKNKL